MKTLLSAFIACMLAIPAWSQVISQFPGKYALSTNDVFLVSTPGVATYKVSLLTLASNLNGLITVVATVTNAVASGSNRATTNATSFGVFYQVSGLTNMEFFGLKQGTNMVLYRDGSNIVLNATGSGSGGGGAGSFGANVNQFTTNTALTIKDGALTTNLVIAGVGYVDGIISAGGTNINAFYGSNYFGGRVQIASGSPGAGKVLTSLDIDGNAAWATGGGGGDVTTAQLNTASNFLYATETTRNAAVSNGVLTVLIANDTTTSNGVVTLLVANDTTTSNGLYAVETTRNAAVSNALVTVVGSHTQMVVAAIGTLGVTNAIHAGTVYANLLNLTNALTTNQVRLGMEDLTNSAAFSPQNGELISWNEANKQWINTAPQWADVVTNITVTATANVLLDFATANVFKLVLRTNLTYTFTNASYLTKRAKVYFLQDLIGTRVLTAFALAGGLLQTNENMQFNTNAAALELMAVEKGFWVTNLVTEWQRDYNARIGPALLAQIVDDFNRANDDPMTINASDGVGVWTSGPGTYNDCFIDSNALRGSTGSDNMARVQSPTFIANQSASVTLAGFGGLLVGVGPAVRIKSITDGDCYFAAAASTTSISIYSVVDDGATIVDTAIGAAFTVAALQTGDRIALTISGTTLELFVNEVSQGTRTDATHSTGQPGIRMINNTGGANSFTAIDL